MDIPTVAIADADQPKGFRLINESDFNPEQHKRYEGKSALPEQSVTPTIAEPTAPIPTVQPSEGLEEMTLTQLQALAQAESVRGRSSMERDALIEALEKKGYRR